MANSSCSPIGYRVSACCIFRDKKAIDGRCPLYFPCAHRCASVAPTQSFEASVESWNMLSLLIALMILLCLSPCLPLLLLDVVQVFQSNTF